MFLYCVFLLFLLPLSVNCLDCNCDGCNGAQYCTGDYCYLLQNNPASAVYKKGCITPREDVWKDETLPLCERNMYNATLCVCNNADLCNKDETFSNILTNGPFVTPKALDCVSNTSDSLPLPLPPCQSSICTYKEGRDYDEFFDLVKPPFSSVYLECPLDYKSNTFSIHLDSKTPQMNSCLHIRLSPIRSEIRCFCNSPKCNSKTPMFNITKRGKGECFLKTPTTETTTCWGDYCFWDGDNLRGCVDASGPDNFKLRLGESGFDEQYFVICEGNYCNSDFQYPNGTIVGPSAFRRFRSSPAMSYPLTPLLLLSLAKILF